MCWGFITLSVTTLLGGCTHSESATLDSNHLKGHTIDSKCLGLHLFIRPLIRKQIVD